VRILVVNKSEQEAGSLMSLMAERGYSADKVQGEEDALSMIEWYRPDAVIVDVEQCSRQELRHLLELNASRRAQFLGLMNKETAIDYDSTLGLDDFVLEPYEPAELITRLERLVRRRDEAANSELLKCGDLVIDPSKYEVRLAGKLIPLTLKEYDLLCFLANNQGLVFSRKALLSKIWGRNYFGGARTVDVHIRRLRSKIEDSRHSFIETVRGAGYKFKE
jgi:two-component system, OmpR family, alkaline phosphatase synthesis response regulator PhoP